MFKKIFIALFLLMFLNLYSYATYNNTNNWYNAVIEYDDFNFNAKLVDWDVEMEWNKFDIDEDLVYYKIVRSVSNSNPVYPTDWYIKYSSDINFTSYIDLEPKIWTNYYRICAITKLKNRYCSNVVKIYYEKEENNKYSNDFCTKEYTPVCGKSKDWNEKTYSNKCVLNSKWAKYLYSWKCESNIVWWDKDEHWCIWSAWYTWCEAKNKCIRTWEEKCEEPSLSDSLKTKSKILVIKLFNTFENKWYTNSEIVKVIDLLIEKLKNLKEEKSNLSSLIDYLIELIEIKKEEYIEDDFSDIEDIFDDFTN